MAGRLTLIPDRHGSAGTGLLLQEQFPKQSLYLAESRLRGNLSSTAGYGWR